MDDDESDDASFAIEEPSTRPSTPVALGPYRAPSRRLVTCAIVPGCERPHGQQNAELLRFLRDVARTHDVSTHPALDSWPRALLRFLGF